MVFCFVHHFGSDAFLTSLAVVLWSTLFLSPCYCHPKFKTTHRPYHYCHQAKLKPPLLWLPASLCCFSCIMVPPSTLGLLLGSSACNWDNPTCLSKLFWTKLHGCLCPNHKTPCQLTPAVPFAPSLACYETSFLPTCTASPVCTVDFAPLFLSWSPAERGWAPKQSVFHACCDGSCLPCSRSTCSDASGMLSWGFPFSCGLSFPLILG